MTNIDKHKAVTTNLRTILRDTVGFQMEEDGLDPDRHMTKPVCKIGFRGLVYESIHGERPKYIDAIYDLQVIFTERDSDAAKDKAQEYIQGMRENVTIDGMNVNGLESGNDIVSHVLSNEIVTAYDEPFVIINYEMSIHYRET